jgi:DNA-binding response OmpR family regulator
VRIVLVDADPRVAKTAFATTAPEDFSIVSCATARAGLNAACALEPDCVVTASHLPDMDGLWLVEALRAQPTTVASTPIVMLSTSDDEATRIQALERGVDVFLLRTLGSELVLAQVRALTAMASRMRQRFSSIPAWDPTSTTLRPGSWLPLDEVHAGRTALRGDLDRVSVASVLSALELEQRSGELWLKAVSGRRLLLTIRRGRVAGGRLDWVTLTPVEAVRAAMDWDGLKFEFTTSTEVASSTDDAAPFVALLLEALEQSSPIADALDALELDAFDDPASGARMTSRPSRAEAPGRALREEVVLRRDPRAEQDDEPTSTRGALGNK